MTLLRFAPIVVEFFGTLFVWLDTERLKARNPPRLEPFWFLVVVPRNFTARRVPFHSRMTSTIPAHVYEIHARKSLPSTAPVDDHPISQLDETFSYNSR